MPIALNNPKPKSSHLKLFLTGHAASSMGTRMQTAALLWHIYDITESPVALGALGLAEWVPLMLLSLVGGDVADRFNRRTIIALAQVIQILPSIVLGFMTLWGAEHLGMLYGVAALGAGAQAFDGSARKALIPQLAVPNELPKAMSAMDLAKNTAKLGGPALMGVVAATVGLGWVYVLNGLSFGLMLAAIWMLPVDRGAVPESNTSEPFMVRLRAGITFMRKSRVVRGLILLDFWGTFCAGAETLLPMVADEVLGLGVEGYGILATGGAIGALLAGVFLVWKPPGRGVGLWVFGASSLYGFSTIGFGVAAEVSLVFVALMMIGAADTVSTVLRNTMVQLATPDGFRGRVTALSMIFSKSGPRLGQMEAGLVAGWFGVTASLVSGGILALLTTGILAVRYSSILSLQSMTDVTPVKALPDEEVSGTRD